MKKLIIMIAATTLLMSCGNNNSQPGESTLYSKAEKYINGKFNVKPKEAEFICKKFDTVIPLSSRAVAYLSNRPLEKEMNKEIELFKELQNIDDKFGGGNSDGTERQRELALKLNDSLKSCYARNDLLDSTDVQAYQVTVFVDGVDKKTGAVKKDVKLAIYFDKQYDVDYDLNEYVYGKINP